MKQPIEKIGVWLHLTDACNLRCSYCYLPHNPITMELNVAKGAIDKAFEMALKYQSHEVDIKYAGGEPLYAFDRLLEIDTFAKALATKHTIKYRGRIITNGTMLDNVKIEAIQQANLSLTVSADGLGEYNAQRLYSNQKSSIEDTLANIELCIEKGLYPTINIVVGEYNIDGLPEFSKWLLERKLKFVFSFVRNHQYRDEFRGLEEQKIIHGLLATFEVIKANLPSYPLAHLVSDKMNPLMAHNYSCAAVENYLGVDPKSNIAKCQMELNKSVSNYLLPDPIADIKADTKFVRSFDVDTIEECKTCEIRYFCTAGCPIETHQATGVYNKKSPNCAIYKAIYDELLKLEALRLIKGLDDLCVEG